jgi:hypothetical protein
MHRSNYNPVPADGAGAGGGAGSEGGEAGVEYVGGAIDGAGA